MDLLYTYKGVLWIGLRDVYAEDVVHTEYECLCAYNIGVRGWMSISSPLRQLRSFADGTQLIVSSAINERVWWAIAHLTTHQLYVLLIWVQIQAEIICFIKYVEK